MWQIDKVLDGFCLAWDVLVLGKCSKDTWKKPPAQEAVLLGQNHIPGHHIKLECFFFFFLSFQRGASPPSPPSVNVDAWAMNGNGKGNAEKPHNNLLGL